MQKDMKQNVGIIIIGALAVAVFFYWLYMRQCVVHQAPGTVVTREAACMCGQGCKCVNCTCVEMTGSCMCGKESMDSEEEIVA